MGANDLQPVVLRRPAAKAPAKPQAWSVEAVQALLDLPFH